MGILGPVTLARYDDWDWGLGVLLGGAVNGIQTFLPRMLAHGEGGHIVNTSSMAGVLPIPGAAIYITAKAALIGLSEALRSELAGEGIGVSAFCPGPGADEHPRGRQDAARALRATPATRSSSASSRSGRTRRSGWIRSSAASACSPASADDDLYIFTHREFREGADERFRAMLASFPDEPLNDERADEIRFLLSNPIFREVARAAIRVSRLH